MENNNQETATRQPQEKTNKTSIANVSDDIQLLLFARHALTAATAGMRILPRDEWDKSFSNLMAKCSKILEDYADE